MEFLMVTGLAGAGKSIVLNALEDVGYFCVDNMLPNLICDFSRLCLESKDTFRRVALVTDVRVGNFLEEILDGLSDAEDDDCRYKILFLDARNEVLITRFKETRRLHPLMKDGGQVSIKDAIEKEREMLMDVREHADYIIDTSFLGPNELKRRIKTMFENPKDSIIVNCMSFGFKYGLPIEADLVFDVRCLSNPFYIEEMRHLTGCDKKVSDFVLGSEKSQGLKKRLIGLLDYLLPLYEDEGKSQIVVAFGCTGGKHRSVTFAEAVYNHFKDKDMSVIVNHRDIDR